MPARSSFRALGHRNFQLFFAGQSVSLIGTWMQQVALQWLVFLLTESAWWLGVVGFAGQIPAFILGPFVGVVVDHVNRHRLIVLTQTLAMLQAFALAALAWSGITEIWPFVVLSVVLGVVNVFDMTARQAFMTEMVTNREDLANAIALNSSVVNGARLVGPMLAGLLLARTSPAVCFLFNGVSYLAVLAALLAMRVVPVERPRPSLRALRTGLRDGLRYAFGFPPIRAILLLLALVSMAGMSYSVLLPVFARDVFRGDAKTYGLLNTCAGLGALAGAVYLAMRTSVLGLGRWIFLASGLFGAALVGISFSTAVGVAYVLLIVAGFGMMVHMAASNTILQTIVEEDKRGRIMSLYTMAFLGMAPLGNLLAGFLAERIGAAHTVRAGGCVCIAGALIFARQLPYLRTLIRPIYVKMGILPEMPSPVQGILQPALGSAEESVDVAATGDKSA
jgi:MFS family permease